jgi:hypothetical protein
MKELLEEYKNISEQICQLLEIDYRTIIIKTDMLWEFEDNNIDAILTYNEFDVFDDFIEYDEICYRHDFVLLITIDNIAIILDKNKQIKEI